MADKAKAALARGVTPIVCVGETLAQRDAGETEAVVKRQLSVVIHALAHCASEIVVAYEPVWAIGTGRTATPEQAQEVHQLLRAQLQAATGQRRADDASSTAAASSPTTPPTLFAQPDIDGGLIGGAALEGGRLRRHLPRGRLSARHSTNLRRPLDMQVWMTLVLVLQMLTAS